MSIHPYLLARLYAIRAAFEQPGFADSLLVSNLTNTDMPAPAKYKQQDDDGDGDSGGGGSTAKGLRGKNDVSAKAAMRRLMRK